LHLDHSDRDFLAVQWTLPTGEIESPIPGNRLMPFISNTPPSIQITSPQVLTYTAPANISLNVSASDADGTVAKVKYYAGNTKIAELTGAQYSYSWTNVTAGSYPVKAVAFDNLGDSTISTPVTITVNPAATGDMAGPNCAARNSNVYYELNAQLRTGASGYNWYFNGSVSNLFPGNQYYTTVSSGANFNGGQICVGVNYPNGFSTPTGLLYYKTYCKSVSYCNSNREGDMTDLSEVTATVVTPNPSREAFHTTIRKSTAVMTVTDQLGKVVYSLSELSQGESVEFGKEFKEGVYIVTFTYKDNTSETLKLIKK